MHKQSKIDLRNSVGVEAIHSLRRWTTFLKTKVIIRYISIKYCSRFLDRVLSLRNIVFNEYQFLCMHLWPHSKNKMNIIIIINASCRHLWPHSLENYNCIVQAPYKIEFRNIISQIKQDRKMKSDNWRRKSLREKIVC